jgi:hypothetical protein
MEVLGMTLRDGRIVEMDRLLAIILGQEKDHFSGLYEQLLRIFSQPETASIIDELEYFIDENRHLLGIAE